MRGPLGELGRFPNQATATLGMGNQFRGLTGNLQGAAEDFRPHLSRGPGNDHPEEPLEKRRRWIIAPESDRNPFGAATPESLRRDEP